MTTIRRNWTKRIEQTRAAAKFCRAYDSSTGHMITVDPARAFEAWNATPRATLSEDTPGQKWRVHVHSNRFYVLTAADPQRPGPRPARQLGRVGSSPARRLRPGPLSGLPGVAEHEETPYARSFLTAAERQLNAPSTTLLRIAATAKQAAARADDSNDDLRVVVFRDIEERCRYLVDAAVVEPVLGRRGWSGRDRAANHTLQQWAAKWGLNEPADGAALPPHAEREPAVPAEQRRQAVVRTAARARCAAGIRCTERNCLTYGAVKVTFLAGAWLCPDCIRAMNTRLTAAGYAPDTVQPAPGGTPERGRYMVRLYNATGKGSRSVETTSPQRAQFIAETERPYNNTDYEIWLPAEPRS
ncbi:hypothetical protein ACIQGT_36805 [Streptomyces sp. NPDC093108]|uniref:hypothetical protein n=1 Tax=Streptomyces sp. NPDC093108 TaxID=3366030 RepID=UPI0038275914